MKYEDQFCPTCNYPTWLWSRHSEALLPTEAAGRTQPYCEVHDPSGDNCGRPNEATK